MTVAETSVKREGTLPKVTSSPAQMRLASSGLVKSLHMNITKSGSKFSGSRRSQSSRLKDLQTRIDDCDFEYAALKQDGKLTEALDVLERCMFLRRERDAGHSEELERTAETFVKDCNMVAMTSLKTGEFILCFELLKKADIVTSEDGLVKHEPLRMRLRAITLNNFGCFYRKRGKLHSALQSLDKALRIELTSQRVDNPAATHMNLCVVLSQLGKHRAALEHASCAIELLHSAIDPRSILGMVAKNRGESTAPTLLAMALHNAAIEHQHLGDFDTASHLLLRAAEAADRAWGPDDVRARAIRRAQVESMGGAWSESEDEEDEEEAGGEGAGDGDRGDGADAEREGNTSEEQGGAEGRKERGEGDAGLGARKKGKGKAGLQKPVERKRTRRMELKELMLAEPIGFTLPAGLPLTSAPQHPPTSGLLPGDSPRKATPGAGRAGEADGRGGRVRFEGARREGQGRGAGAEGEREGGGGAMTESTLRKWVVEGIEALVGEAGSLQEEEMRERLAGLEERVGQFARLLQGEESEELLGQVRRGPAKLRCKLRGPSFPLTLLVVRREVELAELRKEIEQLLDIRTEFWVRYIDEDGDKIRLTDDSNLRNALLDAEQRGGPVALEVYTRLDKERAEAEEARAKAEKERAEAEAAEAKARKEQEEAEEAERLAREAAERAAHAELEHKREEEEARAAEAEAEERRQERDAAEEALGSAAREVARLEAQLKAALETEEKGEEGSTEGRGEGGAEGESGGGGAGGESEGVRAARAAVEAALGHAKGLEAALAEREAEYGAAVRDAEREREEARAARADADRGMQEALEAERVAAKEREEAEEAQREAQREREEAEEAQRTLREEEREFAEAQHRHDHAHAPGPAPAPADPAAPADPGATEWGEARGLSRGQAMVRLAGALRCKFARRDLFARRQVVLARMRKTASLQIQRMYRGLAARQRCKSLRARMEHDRRGREATVIQRYVRGFLERIHVDSLRITAAKASLFLARYRLSGVTVGEATVQPGARGAARRRQEWRQVLQLHDAVAQSGRHAGADSKRGARHAFARVLVRLEQDAARHKREVAAFSALAGGERYALRPAGPRRGDMQFVSLALDHVMNVPLSDGGARHVIVQPLPESTLAQHLPQIRGRGAEPEVLALLHQIVLAVDFLHRAGFCHCNLSAHSLVSINGRWVIGELCDAQLLGAPLDPDSPSVKALHAPEAIMLVEEEEDELLAHPSLDWFLVGLLMYEAFVGHPLFKNYRDAVRQVSENELTIGTGRCKDQVGKYVLENTLCKFPRDRFTAKDLLIMLPQINSAAQLAGGNAASSQQLLDYLKAGGGEADYVGGEDLDKSREAENTM